VLHATHSLLSTSYAAQRLPNMPLGLSPSTMDKVKSALIEEYGEDLAIPNIAPTSMDTVMCTSTPYREGDRQTDRLLAALKLPHIWTIPSPVESQEPFATEISSSLPPPPGQSIQSVLQDDPNEIDI
jgi:hypothetical protein